MAKKYYAVISGKEGSAIYLTWDETKANVDGVSNVKYKSFGDYSEAESFITSAGIKKEDIIFNQDSSVKKVKVKSEDKVSPPEVPGELIAYVDGSFRQGYEVYGYGVVLILDGEMVEKLSGFGKKAKYVSMRNVAGEVLGSIKAMDWAIEKGFKKLHIYFDYEGIEKWATGKWKRNNELTMGYHEYFKDRKDLIEVVFHKVTGHSGDKFNDMADQLAKDAVLSSEAED